MSTKNNPGAFRCYEAALPDEHVFTILARDPAGPATLRFWATEREKLGKTENPDDRDRIEDARRDALLMEDWREKNLDPMGDGSGPSWKLTKITDEEGGPVRVKPDNVQYVPAERDGDEAVRLSVEWLTARTRDLVEGRMSREEYTRRIEIACQSPDRRRATEMMRGSRTFIFDEQAMDNTFIGITEEMQVSLAVLVDNYRAGIEAKANPPVTETLESEEFRMKVRRMLELTKDQVWHGELGRLWQELWRDHPLPSASSRDVTEIDTPDMPPHRFAMFDKGKGWAYGRGLEINPAHIPAMLDRMEEDGYTLVAALGAQADKVGMIFRRGPRYTAFERAHGFGEPAEIATHHPSGGGRATEKSDRFLAGEPFGEIDPPVAESDLDRGRGQEP